MPTDADLTVDRGQLGVRMERNLVKVLKGLAEFENLTLGQLLEKIVLHSFEAVPGEEGEQAWSACWGKRSLAAVADLKRVYGLDYDMHAFRRFRRGGAPRQSRVMVSHRDGWYTPKTSRSTSLTSPSVALSRNASFMGTSRFRVPCAAAAHVGQGGVDRGLIALGPNPLRRAPICWRCSSGSIGNTSAGSGASSTYLLTPDDDLLTVVDRLGVRVGGLLDLVLHEAGLDGRDRAAHAVDLLEVGEARRPRPRR